ncbi:hypothetical protein Hanom_Chr05g00403271 [Helianthus anomalus]
MQLRFIKQVVVSSMNVLDCFIIFSLTVKPYASVETIYLLISCGIFKIVAFGFCKTDRQKQIYNVYRVLLGYNEML